MTPFIPGDDGPPPSDTSPQNDGELWSDYWSRSHRDVSGTGHRYPWGESAWPGTDPSKDKYIYRPELVNIAKALRQDLANYTGAAATTVPTGTSQPPKTTAQQLSDTFGITPGQVGGWDAASTFHGTLTKTQRSMIDAHDAFVAAYQDLITRIEKAAGISQNAEDLSNGAVGGITNNTY